MPSLPETIRARLGQTTYGRQRAIAEENHLLFCRNPAGDWQFSRGGSGSGALPKSQNDLREDPNTMRL